MILSSCLTCRFVGADKKGVKYDKLIHSAWSVGITSIAPKEADPVFQQNMFKYLAELQQDACGIISKEGG